MFPIIVSAGPFVLHTLSIFFVIGFMIAAFLFWRKGREEHYPEGEYFDGFLLASLAGLLVGRLGFIALNFDRFSFSILKWLDVFTYPGVSGLIAVVAATLYLYRYALRNKWDAFEVLDFATIALSSSLIWINLGLFFDGSDFGVATKWPVGMVFPGLQEPHHPTQLYAAVFFILLSFYLGRVEYRYRTFEWYRAGKKTAQTGFLISVFLMSASLFYFGLSWVKNPAFQLYGIDIDRIIAAIGFVYGLSLLFARSGKTVFKRRAPHQLTQDANV